jgi:hypothetical protein
VAEFCSACSKDIFKRDGHDFRGLTSDKDFRGGLACVVLCEGCGAIQVDPNGQCLSACSRRNYPGHNCSWEVRTKKTALDKILSLVFRLLR